MANYPTYATSSDLRDIYPNIDKYDTKTPVYGWEVDSGSRYKATNSGLINQLFANGSDLGSAQASSGAVDTNGEWYYDSGTDTVYYYNDATNPADMLMEAGEDWATHITDMLYKASRYFDSYIDNSLPRQSWKNDENVYDYIVIRTTAQIGAYFLISSHDPENEDGLKLKEEYETILDKINEGGIKLGFEKTQDSSQGILREITATGTLKPVDLRGNYYGIYDKIRLQITTAGEIGTATYSVWVAGNNKLGINKGTQIETDQIITGEYQTLSTGLQVRFGASSTVGTAGTETSLMDASGVLNDVWEIEAHGVGESVQDSKMIRSIEAVRV